MTVWHSSPEHFLVGEFAWLTPTRVFWFAANGDSDADVHTLEFEHVIRKRDGLHFFHDGKQVGQLAPIDQAHVEDPEDFRVAWQIWQTVAPTRRALIDNSRLALVESAREQERAS